MPKPAQIEEFLTLSGGLPIVDVRSPGEFQQGHIPGAHNIPLFTNEERAIVGTLYKQQGKDPALLKGLELVGPKLADFARQAKKISAGRPLLVHCWRGGMRSASMATLFEAAGIETRVLAGGYKKFRSHILSHFAFPIRIMIVGGETGSGKTEILHELKKRGEQILDLEHLASHRGSSFGAIGMSKQPTVEQFENDLFHHLSLLDTERRVWVEDESRSIGRVFLPEDFWTMMENAPVMRIKVPFSVRVERLIKDYGQFPKETLEEALVRIRKRLGGLALQEALDAFHQGDYKTATEIALRYYDKAYDFPHKDRNYRGVHFIETDSGDPAVNAEKILSAAEKTQST